MTARPTLLALTMAGLLAASAAFADYQQDIVQQLQGMGFSRIEVTRTLLGRVRITAMGEGGTREIILNPNTGEILRDLWSQSDGRAADRALLDDRRQGSDPDDDRARSDSNSGSGSSGSSNSGSGSGSGNSGSGGGESSRSGSNSGSSNSGSGKSGGDDDSGRDSGKDSSDDDSDDNDSGGDSDSGGGDDD